MHCYAKMISLPLLYFSTTFTTGFLVMQYTKGRTRLDSFREWTYNSRDSIRSHFSVFICDLYAVVHKLHTLTVNKYIKPSLKCSSTSTFTEENVTVNCKPLQINS